MIGLAAPMVLYVEPGTPNDAQGPTPLAAEAVECQVEGTVRSRQ